MTEDTSLMRQIHPSWVQSGRVTSQAFKPTPKDEGLLSTYDGDQISEEQSWNHYTVELKLTSCGVLGVTVSEFAAEQLPARPDPEPFPSHVVVDYNGFNGKQIEKKSKRLRRIAEVRGWLFQAPRL